MLTHQVLSRTRAIACYAIVGIAVSIGILPIMPTNACAGGRILSSIERHDAEKRDEGMWTFDSPPLKILFDKYGFTPSKEWLDTLRLASIRFTTGGGSGAFVSANGLVITNHHIVMEQLQRLSTTNRDIVTNGFVAASQGQELKCSDVELNVLVSMENITARLLLIAKQGMSDDEVFKARQREIRAIENEANTKNSARVEVVSLYAGGEYWLYTYKRYTDVRLVVAPELQAANFGGDYDNFTYPRYALDFALVRVYENGKPLHSTHFLKWNTAGASAKELLAVSGHPGATNRLNTYSQFVFNRDIFYPFMLRRINTLLLASKKYAERGQNEARQALDDILNYENAKKSLIGEYQGLQNRAIEEKCKRSEAEIRAKVNADGDLQRLYGNAWEIIERIAQKQSVIFKEYTSTFSTPLADIAFALIRYTIEAESAGADKSANKPTSRTNAAHTTESVKTLLADLRTQALAPTAIELDYEEAKIAGELEFLLSELSAGDPLVKIMLGEGSILRTPREVAREAMRGTRLTDVSFRRALLEGGRKAIDRSTDPMIVFMRKLVPLWLDREEYQRINIQAPLASALEKLALARFAVYGKSAYPDATFTLRLSFGEIQGYPMNGTIAPPRTTLYGLFDRAQSFANNFSRLDAANDFAIPERVNARRDKLNLATPVNFITTCDIVGGNSGSPLVNRNLEFVGLVFDGNIESLAGRFVYNEAAGRTLCVHPAFIIEALRKVYDAPHIADELESSIKIPLRNEKIEKNEKPSEQKQPNGKGTESKRSSGMQMGDARKRGLHLPTK
jgi:Peptidase S46